MTAEDRPPLPHKDDSDDLLLEGTVALVTGASRGLGRAIAEQLGAAGAQIVAVARTVGGLEEMDDAIQRAGGPKALLAPLDLSDLDGVDRLGAALHERYGRLDMLVHAAAHAAPLTPAAHLEPKELERLMSVNAVATARLIRSLDPLLRLSGAGRAVFMIDRKAGAPFWGGYGASKAAAEALARSYAAEAATGERAVDVHLFEPPPMPTALRARTHPGEDRAHLTPCAVVAGRVTALLRERSNAAP